MLTHEVKEGIPISLHYSYENLYIYSIEIAKIQTHMHRPRRTKFKWLYFNILSFSP